MPESIFCMRISTLYILLYYYIYISLCHFPPSFPPFSLPLPPSSPLPLPSQWPQFDSVLRFCRSYGCVCGCCSVSAPLCCALRPHGSSGVSPCNGRCYMECTAEHRLYTITYTSINHARLIETPDTNLPSPPYASL